MNERCDVWCPVVAPLSQAGRTFIYYCEVSALPRGVWKQQDCLLNGNLQYHTGNEFGHVRAIADGMVDASAGIQPFSTA